MLRLLLWEAGVDYPRSILVQQTVDVSPAMALTMDQSGFPVGAIVVLGGDPEVVYCGQVNGKVEWNEVTALVREDAAGLPINHGATMLLRFFGAHPRDIPRGGIRGDVIFANRNRFTNTWGDTTAAVAAIASSEGLPEMLASGQGALEDLPSGLTVPPGVVLDNYQLFMLAQRSKESGCDLVLPDWLPLVVSGESHHVLTNQSENVAYTMSGVAFLRCILGVAVKIAGSRHVEPADFWVDCPLGIYISLPVPGIWDPSSPQFQGGRHFKTEITVGDLLDSGLS